MFSGAAICCLLNSNYLEWEITQLLGAYGEVVMSWSSGKQFQYLIVQGKFIAVLTGMDSVECFIV